MDFKALAEKIASDIGGTYRDYDDTSCVIIVPLKDGRFQAVTGHEMHNDDYDRDVIQLKTKVCSLSSNIPYEEILAASANYPYSKFIVEDEYLKLEAIAFLDTAAEEEIREMFIEIAQHADDWEFKITGKDIH